MPQLIDSAVTAVLPAARAKGIDVSHGGPDGLPPIEGDPKRLQQVLGNVLSNAIKFTPDHGFVRVNCALEDGSIAIEVRDSGAGIAPEFLPFVFDRFRQADSRSTRKHGGLGLGLAIARHIVEQHDGEIEAHSDGPGRGTTIRIRIPVSPSARNETVARMLPARAGIRLDGCRVLVVDDQADSRGLLAAIFDRCGAQVVQCASAQAALERLRAEPISLLVADIAMPDMDGYELIERVRANQDRPPAVAVSAYARLEDRNRALGAGYDAYCAKPFDADEFLRIVHGVLLAPS